MAEKKRFQAIKGTRDLLPPETELWNRVEAVAREVFGTYGFGEIRPPILEPTELFARAVGGETDIVSKEMYTLEDHDFAELERLRTDLLFQTPEAFNVASMTRYSSRLEKFIEKFEDGITKRRMPATPENNRALENLRVQVSHMRFLTEQIAAGAPDIQFDPSLNAVRQALRVARFGDVISLRPEATASVCRAYIEHNMHAMPQPVKLYYIGPMFRRERPQKGRYRQFYQIGAEVLEREVTSGEGRVASKELEKDAAVDAEVIEMVMTFFDRLKLPGTQLDINSIGHNAPECRRGYVEKLRGALLEVKDQLGEDSRRRIETNPLRVLDSKLEHEQAIIATLPKIGDCLCDDCAKHYTEVKRQLDLRGIPYQENWRLVRGLDYYMRTTFEITAKGLGSQNAVCGGGRYDGLVELLGGPATKGIGFAIGEDRLVLSLQEAAKEVASGEWGVASEKGACDVYIAWMGQKTQETAIKAARVLRDSGLRVELPAMEQKFGKALGQADRLGARYALILGEDEVASGLWTLKKLADGTQEKVLAGDLVGRVRGGAEKERN